MRVLLVEDDKALNRALRVILRARGHWVDPVAWPLVGPRIKRPEIVLVGVRMPEHEAVAAMLGSLRRTYRAPVVALSEDWPRCTGQGEVTGADAWLRKPFGIAQLMSCMEDVVRRPGPAIGRELMAPTT